jgi:hypothetical protein
MKPSHFMSIKILFIAVINFFLFCSREENAWNEVRIINSTNDTLVLNLSKKYISDEGDNDTLYPNGEHLLARALYTSGFGIVKDDFGDSRDTLKYTVMIT